VISGPVTGCGGLASEPRIGSYSLRSTVRRQAGPMAFGGREIVAASLSETTSESSSRDNRGDQPI